MSFLTTLDVVNAMLGTLGESPLNELDEDHPMTAAALRVLKLVNHREQSRGWWFNKERVRLVPDPVSSYIYTPEDAVRCDPVDKYSPLVQRGRRMYNTVETTYAISDEILCDLVRLLPFEDCPPSAQSYISDACCVQFQAEYDGDQIKGATLQQAKQQSYMILNAEHIRNQRVNFLASGGVQATLAQMGAPRSMGLIRPMEE